MDEQDNTKHRLKHLYEDALLVGKCEQTPNHLLVCFLPKDEDKVHRALDDFEARHGHRPKKFIGKKNAFIGFWIEKSDEVVTDPVLARLKPPRLLAEAKFLETRAHQGTIILLQAPTLHEMDERLSGALERATVATQSPYLN